MARKQTAAKTVAGIPFEAVRRDASLSDKVAEQLTEAIVSRRLQAGARMLSERDLGIQFGVSRTVIREAVRSLVARGLLVVTSGRGVQVGEIDTRNVTTSLRLLIRAREGFDYGKVHEVRAALEVQTAGLAAERASKDDIARLAELCDAFDSALTSGDTPRVSEADYQFHRELACASGNELLLAMLDSIADVLHEVRDEALGYPGVAETGRKAHRWILECVKASDPTAARLAMERHLAAAASFWRSHANTQSER